MVVRFERHTRKNALEICGKPEGEEAVLKVAGTLEVPMCEEDIEISPSVGVAAEQLGNKLPTRTFLSLTRDLYNLVLTL